MAIQVLEYPVPNAGRNVIGFHDYCINLGSGLPDFIPLFAIYVIFNPIIITQPSTGAPIGILATNKHLITRTLLSTLIKTLRHVINFLVLSCLQPLIRTPISTSTSQIHITSKHITKRHKILLSLYLEIEPRGPKLVRRFFLLPDLTTTWLHWFAVKMLPSSPSQSPVLPKFPVLLTWVGN